MSDMQHSPRCPICQGHGYYLDEIDPDQGPIWEPCPIAEEAWWRRQDWSRYGRSDQPSSEGNPAA